MTKIENSNIIILNIYICITIINSLLYYKRLYIDLLFDCSNLLDTIMYLSTEVRVYTKNNSWGNIIG